MMELIKKLVTPEMAKSYLEKNTNNRKLSERVVMNYVMQMKAGQWLLTSDAIMFDPNGEMMNGQHRMKAVTIFGKPVEFYIAKDVDENVFKVLDTGKTRTAGDVLAINGYSHANQYASVARQILLFEGGRYSVMSGAAGSINTSNSTILSFVEKYTDVLEETIAFAKDIHSRATSKALTTTTLAMLYWVLGNKHTKSADTFFEKYATGSDLGVNSPIRLLRERFIKDSYNKSKLSLRDKLALFIFAWNAHRQGKQMQQLTLQRNYNFPKPL